MRRMLRGRVRRSEDCILYFSFEHADRPLRGGSVMPSQAAKGIYAGLPACRGTVGMQTYALPHFQHSDSLVPLASLFALVSPVIPLFPPFPSRTPPYASISCFPFPYLPVSPSPFTATFPSSPPPLPPPPLVPPHILHRSPLNPPSGGFRLQNRTHSAVTQRMSARGTPTLRAKMRVVWGRVWARGLRMVCCLRTGEGWGPWRVWSSRGGERSS